MCSFRHRESPTASDFDASAVPRATERRRGGSSRPIRRFAPRVVCGEEGPAIDLSPRAEPANSRDRCSRPDDRRSPAASRNASCKRPWRWADHDSRAPRSRTAKPRQARRRPETETEPPPWVPPVSRRWESPCAARCPRSYGPGRPEFDIPGRSNCSRTGAAIDSGGDCLSTATLIDSWANPAVGPRAR